MELRIHVVLTLMKIHSGLDIEIIEPQRYNMFFLPKFSLGLEMIAATFLHLCLIKFHRSHCEGLDN